MGADRSNRIKSVEEEIYIVIFVIFYMKLLNSLQKNAAFDVDIDLLAQMSYFLLLKDARY